MLKRQFKKGKALIMNNPFDGLTKIQINKLFHLLGSHLYRYNKNQEILPTIKSENIICIVMKGHAQILSIDYNGNEIISEEIKENEIFGSNITAISGENYEIFAKEDTEVLVINYNNFMNPKNLNYIYFNIFMKNIFDIINSKFNNVNERLQVLEKKTIRDRLLEYFELQYSKTYTRTIYLPFNLKDLSNYISVNRSAMFRELKNLKEEKFINIKGKKITLLYK